MSSLGLEWDRLIVLLPQAAGKCLSENMPFFELLCFPFFTAPEQGDNIERYRFEVTSFLPKATKAQLQTKMGKKAWQCAAGDPKEGAKFLVVLILLVVICGALIIIYLWRFAQLFRNKGTTVGSKQYWARCFQIGLWPCWFCCKSQMLVPDDLLNECKWIPAQKQISMSG